MLDSKEFCQPEENFEPSAAIRVDPEAAPGCECPQMV